MPLPEPTLQVSLLILCDEVSMMNILMHAISSHIRSLARSIVNTLLNRHLRRFAVGDALQSRETQLSEPEIEGRVVKTPFNKLVK
jgi:hypothetical protein